MPQHTSKVTAVADSPCQQLGVPLLQQQWLASWLAASSPVTANMQQMLRSLAWAGGVVLAAAVVLLMLLPVVLALLGAWLLIELLFYALVTSPRAQHAAQLNRQPVEGHWPADREDAERAFQRFVKYCKDAPGRLDHSKYLSGWFLGADMSSIKRGNVEEFVAYGFCYRTREQLQAEGRGDLASRMTDELQEIWGIELPPGYNPDIKFMAHLWEPVLSYRPLLFYLIMELVAYFSRQYLRAKGFACHNLAGITFYTLHLGGSGSSTSTTSSSAASSSSSKAEKPTNSSQAAHAAAAAQSDKACNGSSHTKAAAAQAEGGSKASESLGSNPAGVATGVCPAAAAAGADAAAGKPDVDGSSTQQQVALQPIPEQPASPKGKPGPQPSPQQRQQLPEPQPPQQPPPPPPTPPLPPSSALLEPPEQLAGASAAAAAAAAAVSPQPPQPPAPPASNGLSAYESELFESPFALVDELPGQDLDTSDVAAAAETAAPRAGTKTARSVPAARAAAAAAAAAGAAGAGVQQSLRNPASWSVLPTSRSWVPACHDKPTPLQAALSAALTDAGIVQAGVPVVFLHGIGGLPAYLELLQYLVAEGNPLLAIEVKSVAMRLCHVYSVTEVAAVVLDMMDQMQLKKACLVAHSYGTFVASYLMKHHPARVKGCVLIDPVCLGMFMPTLIYSFLYRQPVWQGWGKPELVTYVKAAVRRFIASESHVRASVARRFFWTQLNAWPEDLSANSTILLSGKDDLMDSPEVNIMLEGARHIKVRYNEDLTHGAFLLNKQVKEAITRDIKALLVSSGSAIMSLAHQLSALVTPTGGSNGGGAAGGDGAAPPSRVPSFMRSALRKVPSLHLGARSSSASDVAGASAHRSRLAGQAAPRTRSDGKLAAAAAAAAGSADEDAADAQRG